MPGWRPLSETNQEKRKSMKNIWCLALGLTLALSGCGGGSSLTLTEDNYNKIQNDMSEADVKAILGEPTSQDSKPIPIVGGEETTYIYSNTQNGNEVTIVFKNDKEQSKTSHFNP
jgi:uncharacterized lipoprotein YehR (DUF1307 family)